MKRGRWKTGRRASAAGAAAAGSEEEEEEAFRLRAAGASAADSAAADAEGAAGEAAGEAEGERDAAKDGAKGGPRDAGADATATAAGTAIVATTGSSVKLEPAGTTSSGFQWKVLLFNCECHTFDEVERQLMKATRCSLSRARELAWKVHSEGLAVVYSGPTERCEAAAAVLEDIRLKVKVTQ